MRNAELADLAEAGGLADLNELLSGATERETLEEAPGKSGARIERVVIDGQRFVLKHMDPGSDWSIRASGSLRGASLLLWERGSSPGCPTAWPSRSSPSRWSAGTPGFPGPATRC